MSGSSGCRVEPLDEFADSLATFLKENYGKHEAKGREEGKGAVGAVLSKLFDWPNISGSHPEPFPPKSKAGEAATKAGWTLYKHEFNVPRLSGAAKCGRLIYLVHKDNRILVPLCVYSHKQFEGRVPDKALEALLAEANALQEKREAERKVVAAGGSAPGNTETAPSPEPAASPSGSKLTLVPDSDK